MGIETFQNWTEITASPGRLFNLSRSDCGNGIGRATRTGSIRFDIAQLTPSTSRSFRVNTCALIDYPPKNEIVPRYGILRPVSIAQAFAKCYAELRLNWDEIVLLVNRLERRRILMYPVNRIYSSIIMEEKNFKENL